MIHSFLITMSDFDMSLHTDGRFFGLPVKTNSIKGRPITKLIYGAIKIPFKKLLKTRSKNPVKIQNI